MRKRSRRVRPVVLLGVVLMLAAGKAPAIELKIKTLAAGLGWDHFQRTVVWKGDESSSKIISNLVSARAEIGLEKGVVFSLSVGLSFTDFTPLTFSALPITLRFDGAPLTGFTLGGDVLVPVRKLGDFEISAAGRIVYSRGMSKTWPLEGFAVEGEAAGHTNWVEIALGPRFAYLFFGRIVPYVEVNFRWLTAGFGITESLGELDGEEKRRIGGDIAFSVAIGADAKVTDRISVRAKAGIMPYAGGVDGLASVGFMYGF